MDDLRGIKLALRYLIEKERDEKLNDMLSSTIHGIYPQDPTRDYRQEEMDRIRKDINKEFEPILDALR